MGTAWRNLWTQWTFDGRASRSEYWFAYIAYTLTLFVIAMLPDLLRPVFQVNLGVSMIPSIVCTILIVVSIFPLWFLTVRRLHDIGHSGWCLLPAIVPVIGVLILFSWLCTKSDPLPNKYGPVPNCS